MGAHGERCGSAAIQDWLWRTRRKELPGYQRSELDSRDMPHAPTHTCIFCNTDHNRL